jgi:malic enzyme
MHSIVNNWQAANVDIIVITDGSRILGLGDQVSTRSLHC